MVLLANLTTVLKNIANNYQKKVLVAETSYAYTLKMVMVILILSQSSAWVFIQQPSGQANAVRDAIQAVSDVGPNGIECFTGSLHGSCRHSR